MAPGRRPRCDVRTHWDCSPNLDGDCFSKLRFDQNRPPPPDRLRRAVLLRRRRPQVDRPPVEPYAHPRVRREPIHRPGGGDFQRPPVKAQDPLAGSRRRSSQQAKKPDEAQQQRGSPEQSRTEGPVHDLHFRYKQRPRSKVAPAWARACRRESPFGFFSVSGKRWYMRKDSSLWGPARDLSKTGRESLNGKTNRRGEVVDESVRSDPRPSCLALCGGGGNNDFRRLCSCAGRCPGPRSPLRSGLST